MDTSKHALGMILESPVTSYEYINNQTCEYLMIPKFLHQYMMIRLIKYYNKLNPSVFQAKNLDHPIYLLNGVYQIVLRCWSKQNMIQLLEQNIQNYLLMFIQTFDTDFTFHIVENLKHAYESKNDVRDSLIRNWMEEKSLFFR